MRFFLGLVTGFVVGAAAAVLYSSQSGVDLGKEFERVRSDIQQRDFEALSDRLDDRFKDLQSSLESKMGQRGDDADATLASIEVATDDAGDSVDVASEETATA